MGVTVREKPKDSEVWRCVWSSQMNAEEQAHRIEEERGQECCCRGWLYSVWWPPQSALWD